MKKYHDYSLQELEHMVPWEREVYVAMVIEHVKEENERKRAQQSQ